MWDFEIWFEEIRSVFPYECSTWSNKWTFMLHSQSSLVSFGAEMETTRMTTNRKVARTATKNGKLNKKGRKGTKRVRERESKRTVCVSYVCCMLKCTLHKYISYVECVCRIFGTFKIDRCDVFSTRYANGLFDRSQKITWSRVVNGAQSDGKKRSRWLEPIQKTSNLPG